MQRPIACGRRIRVSVWVFVLVGSWMCGAFGFWAMTERVNFPTVRASTPRYQPLSMDDRVMYQRKLEAVYWKHRLWPAENPKPKPSFDQVTTEADLRHQVETTVRQSLAWQVVRHQPVSGEELQAELDRIARQSRDTELLQELFDALDNDPAVIAECLVRPLLVQRELGKIFEHQVPAESEIPDQSTAAELTFDAWWTALASSRDIQEFASPHFAYRMPDLSAARRFDPSATDCDQWSPMNNDRGPFRTPYGGGLETAVWTGSEMIVWGGGTNRGSRYNPALDIWLTISHIGAPVKRFGHTVVWTGQEMIIWGGRKATNFFPPFLKSGGRYNPRTNTWKVITLTGAPSARMLHSAVWTGNEMIVWGGSGIENNLLTTLSNGARYSPESNTWKPLSLVQSPAGRTNHRAVWTGKEMIIWGGLKTDPDDRLVAVNTGGRYFPETDTWQPTSLVNAPFSRAEHIAIWTGTEMIVWGGINDEIGLSVGYTGGRYDPETDTWFTMRSYDPFYAARSYFLPHGSAVWTGEEMIVWAGDGACYNPKTDTWTPIPDQKDPPNITIAAVTVWTGEELIVWGGYEPKYTQISVRVNYGGRYNPKTGQWTEMSVGEPQVFPRGVIWTGVEMIVMGQNETGSGSRYFPATDSWATIPVNPTHENLFEGTSVWTGTEALFIGGMQIIDAVNALSFSRIYRYNPTRNQWMPVGFFSYAEGWGPAAVWTGTEVLIWGGAELYGEDYDEVNTGCRYNPETNESIKISQAGAPNSRVFPTAIWTGKEMILWGGYHNFGKVNTGGRYDPVTDTWTSLSTANAPQPRDFYSTIWTGKEMIVWGGLGNGKLFADGKRYDPVSDEWKNMNLAGAPEKRYGHTAVWTGSRMIIWGGDDEMYGQPYLNTGAEYDPIRDVWKPLPTLNAPPGRVYHWAIWTGKVMIIWGEHKKGGQYRPCGSTQ